MGLYYDKYGLIGYFTHLNEIRANYSVGDGNRKSLSFKTSLDTLNV